MVLGVPALAAGSLTQCWVDDHGQRSCGDIAPPTKPRQFIDGRGVTIKSIEPEKSAEEKAAASEALVEHKRQEAYDRYLLQTYRSVGDLERARDGRLATVDSRLSFAEKALSDNGAVLGDLRKRAEAPPEAGEAADASSVKRQILEFNAARREHLEAIEKLKSERTKVRETFDRDIDRFQSLHAAPGATSSR